MINNTLGHSTIATLLRHIVIAVMLAILLTPFNAEAWQIISAHRIADGAVALSEGPGGLWTGYEGDREDLIRIIDEDNGELRGRINSPEEVCFGLTQSGRSIWFAGADNLYLLNEDGEVTREVESPYQVMHGLAAVGDELWTMVQDGGVYYLTQFEPGGEESTRFGTELHNPVGISWDGSFLWVTDRVDGFLHVFNPESEEEIDLFPTPFSHPSGIVHIGDEILLIDDGGEEDSDVLYRIDPAGASGPRLLPYSRNYRFDNRFLGSPIEIDLPLYNIGDENLVVESVRLLHGRNGFDLGRQIDDIQIRPGNLYNVPIIFVPGDYQHYRDTLIIISNDPAEPEMLINITGLGIFNTRRLGVYPEVLNFGTVRADRWRDGVRIKKLAIFNKGADEMIVDALEHRIHEIFELEFDDLPQRLGTAETLWVDVSFTPHRDITYRDTLRIYSNENRRVNNFAILGTGSDSVYAAGSVLWMHELEEGEGPVGGISIMRDLNGDEVDEIIAVGPTGNSFCISGFASGEADLFWQQNFGNHVFAPVDLEPSDVIVGNSDLNGDGRADAIIGSGAEDRSVYALNGRNGDLLWHWDAHVIGATGAIIKIESSNDYNGDSANDPVVLIEAVEDGTERLVRLNGANGRPVWIANPGPATTVGPLKDFDRDGVIDYFTTGNDDMIRIYSGVDGGVMREYNSPTGGVIEVAGDLNDDGEIDILFGGAEGNLTAWSIEDESEIWSVDQIGGIQLRGPLDNLHLIDNDFNNDGTNDALVTDGSELIFCFDPLTGEEIWITQVENLIMMIPIADSDTDGVMDVAVALEDGSIKCFSGQDGSEIWSYQGQDGVVVSNMLTFDDVDLGGTNDLVAIFTDRVVRCISTGGDLLESVREDDNIFNPKSSSLVTLYPNPFNGSTIIDFTLKNASNITLSIWDTNGRLIKSTELGHYNVGSHQYLFTEFSSNKMAAGLYYFEILSKTERLVQSGILLK